MYCYKSIRMLGGSKKIKKLRIIVGGMKKGKSGTLLSQISVTEVQSGKLLWTDLSERKFFVYS